MLDNIQVDRAEGHNPIFDAAFTSWEGEGIFSLGALACDPMDEDELPIKAKYDLTFDVHFSEEIQLSVEYAAELFEDKSIRRMVSHYRQLLLNLLENDTAKVQTLQMVTETEIEQILGCFNDTDIELPRGRVYHEIFRSIAAQYPNQEAVIFDPPNLMDHERACKYTYSQLDQLTDALAVNLRKKGVVKDEIVGIMVERSVDILVGTIAVMKAGGAYLPIDAHYPAERIAFILKDSGAKIVLTQPWIQDRLNGFGGEILDITQITDVSIQERKEIKNINTEDDLCYLIYTSGSTGTPKGVMIEHKGLINMCEYQAARRGFNLHSRIIEYFSFVFDGSVCNMFPILTKGGTVHILSERERRDMDQLVYTMKQATAALLPTAIFEAFTESQLEDISSADTEIIVAGEKLARANTPIKKLVNAYGPTETSVEATEYDIIGNEIDIPIGKPMFNTKVYIVDDHDQLCPIGVPGELCISGVQLARGYRNNKSLTDEKFVPNPFTSTYEYSRMYRTGDLAKWRTDGNIDFLGRIDFQVKLRGYRIELGEIEAAVTAERGITAAVATVRKNKAGSPFLAAYYVTEDNLLPEELKMHMKTKLPGYMVPQYFVKLKELPLTINGKVDLSALPEINDTVEYFAPRTDLERRLVRIWADLLHLEEQDISIKDEFFRIGGNSIKAIRMVSEAKLQGIEIQTKGIFESTTIESLAASITKNDHDLNVVNTQVLLDESFVQKYYYGFPKHDSNRRIYQNQYQTILMTGVTGFLGVHVAKELLDTTKARIICIVRGKNEQMAKQRFLNCWHYYFKSKYEDSRIQVFAGDISLKRLGLKDEAYQCCNQCDAILNCAADVRFFQDYRISQRTNVLGVEHIIFFAEQNRLPIYHISTESVSGDITEQPILQNEFTENVLYIGQEYKENAYVHSKFEAERLLIDASRKGLSTTIYRIGNLTGRYQDGRFQTNIWENYFYNGLRFMLQTGLALKERSNDEIEMTPVDTCASAIVRLMLHGQTGKAYHVWNHHTQTEGELIQMFDSLGFKINCYERPVYAKRMEALLLENTDPKLFLGVINEFQEQEEKKSDQTGLVIRSDITRSYLEKMGFSWPKINREYLVSVLDDMQKKGFLK